MARSSWTAAGFPRPRLVGLVVLASGALKPSPPASALSRLYQASRSAVSPAPYTVPWVRFGRFVRQYVPPNIRNPRYEWLARPCSAGTLTLQEAPSFAWRTSTSGALQPRGPQLRLKGFVGTSRSSTANSAATVDRTRKNNTDMPRHLGVL